MCVGGGACVHAFMRACVRARARVCLLEMGLAASEIVSFK